MEYWSETRVHYDTNLSPYMCAICTIIELLLSTNLLFIFFYVFSQSSSFLSIPAAIYVISIQLNWEVSCRRPTPPL